MNNLESKNNVSLVNLILPKDSLSSVTSDLQKAGAKGIFHVAARGSIISEGGFLSKMFPPPAPEQCLVQVLIPDSEKQRLSDVAISSGRLDRVGAGAIFSISCDKAYHSQSFPLTDGSDEFNSHQSASMEAICCICEKGVAEDIAQAALTAGAPGPTVTFGEGGGIRDKIPLLRMTKGPEKEFVWCVVDRSESSEVLLIWPGLVELLSQVVALCTPSQCLMELSMLAVLCLAPLTEPAWNKLSLPLMKLKAEKIGGQLEKVSPLL